MRNFKNFLDLLRKLTNSRFLFYRKDDAMRVRCVIDEYFDRELNKYIKRDDVIEMKGNLQQGGFQQISCVSNLQ